jgi:hypothetical protein
MANAGEEALGTKLLDCETLVNLEILEKSPDALYFYGFKNEFGIFVKINLPRPRLFDSANKKWKVTQSELYATGWEIRQQSLKEDPPCEE